MNPKDLKKYKEEIDFWKERAEFCSWLAEVNSKGWEDSQRMCEYFRGGRDRLREMLGESGRAPRSFSA